MKKLLVIIDMVNGFVKEGALSDININRITPNIVTLVKEFVKKGYPIITFRDAHHEDDDEMKFFPIHCLKETSESKLIDELSGYKDYYIDIEKNTTNGFDTYLFRDYILKNQFEEVIITGCCTDICVETFALSLKKHFLINNINTKIIVYENTVYTFNSPIHNALECHQKSLEKMQENGIIIL